MTPKYNAFFNIYWGGISSASQKELLADQEPEFRAGWAVFKELNSRGGFDHWWDDIDGETQDECFDAIVESIRTAMGKTPGHEPDGCLDCLRAERSAC